MLGVILDSLSNNDIVYYKPPNGGFLFVGKYHATSHTPRLPQTWLRKDNHRS